LIYIFRNATIAYSWGWVYSYILSSVNSDGEAEIFFLDVKISCIAYPSLLSRSRALLGASSGDEDKNS